MANRSNFKYCRAAELFHSDTEDDTTEREKKTVTTTIEAKKFRKHKHKKKDPQEDAFVQSMNEHFKIIESFRLTVQ
ncbi:unnamed protein product [Macrosiphum euphorbiae]|uniref:Uncharacterized protein n=1 Tax=Macrosiphum euphorbiae TaxID=13131 RepID=A0AAV0XZ55_9HEMI|nr:unnamed protein product [Macrosiphum euphorbiae]